VNGVVVRVIIIDIVVIKVVMNHNESQRN